MIVLLMFLIIFLVLIFNLGLGSNTQLSLEAAASITEQDKRSAYGTKKRGNSLKLV